MHEVRDLAAREREGERLARHHRLERAPALGEDRRARGDRDLGRFFRGADEREVAGQALRVGRADCGVAHADVVAGERVRGEEQARVVGEGLRALALVLEGVELEGRDRAIARDAVRAFGLHEALEAAGRDRVAHAVDPGEHHDLEPPWSDHDVAQAARTLREGHARGLGVRVHDDHAEVETLGVELAAAEEVRERARPELAADVAAPQLRFTAGVLADADAAGAAPLAAVAHDHPARVLGADVRDVAFAEAFARAAGAAAVLGIAAALAHDLVLPRGAVRAADEVGPAVAVAPRGHAREAAVGGRAAVDRGLARVAAAADQDERERERREPADARRHGDHERVGTSFDARLRRLAASARSYTRSAHQGEGASETDGCDHAPRVVRSRERRQRRQRTFRRHQRVRMCDVDICVFALFN